MLAISSLLVFTGCASLLTGGDLVREGEPTGSLEVVNNSPDTITALLISDCDASTYGLNRLPSGIHIAPNTSYKFTVSAGCWDVSAGVAAYTSGTDGGGAEARKRMSVQAGGITRYTVTGR